LNYVGGKIHEIGDEIEFNTKYLNLVVLLEKTLGFNGVSKLFYKVSDMDLRTCLVCMYSDTSVSEMFGYIQKIDFIDMYVEKCLYVHIRNWDWAWEWMCWCLHKGGWDVPIWDAKMMMKL
jgi:hypothetical protein